MRVALIGLLAMSLAGCGTVIGSSAPPEADVSASLSSPTALAAPTPDVATPATTSTARALTPTPAPTPTDLEAGEPSISPPLQLPLGVIVTTAVDGLRVRSEPRIATDSIRYAPTLAVMTDLVVTSDPVLASGYWWYRVHLPHGKALDGGITDGWIAGAARDGTPWVERAMDFWGSDVHIGARVRVLVHGLALRSQPRLGTDSLVYRTLPDGADLLIIDGPLEASGHTWYAVIPLGVATSEDPAYGWVASRSKDGTRQWIGHDSGLY